MTSVVRGRKLYPFSQGRPDSTRAMALQATDPKVRRYVLPICIPLSIHPRAISSPLGGLLEAMPRTVRATLLGLIRVSQITMSQDANSRATSGYTHESYGRFTSVGLANVVHEGILAARSKQVWPKRLPLVL